MTEAKTKSKKGAIVLLDFLGWKGIWLGDYKESAFEDAHSGFDYRSLDRLGTLLGEIEKRFNEKSNSVENFNVPSKAFISISDTIAMFTACEDESNWYELLKLQATICGGILDLASDHGFALRGAITVGEYATLENIMVGPGVDECASWYEQTNWLGVIFAPSAQFVIDEAKKVVVNNDHERYINEYCIKEYNCIPLKNGFKGLKYCVTWGEREDILNTLLKNTLSLSIDVAQKYINTQKYLYEIRPKKTPTEQHNDDK